MEELLEHRFFANFRKYKFLLNQLIKREIQLKYRKSVLGIFWSFLEPLLTMIVLTIIFSTIFRGWGIENYPVYLLTGRLFYELFSRGTSAAMRSIRGNAATLKNIYIPKYIYPLSVITSNFITFSLSLVVLFLVMLATQAPFTLYIIFTIMPIIALLLFTLGVGLILATINVFFRDLEYLYGVFLILLMYAIPIFYPAEIVPANFRFIQNFNPIYAVINSCRSVFLEGVLYDPQQMLFAMISGVVALIIGLIVFYKFQNKFVLHI